MSKISSSLLRVVFPRKTSHHPPALPSWGGTSITSRNKYWTISCTYLFGMHMHAKCEKYPSNCPVLLFFLRSMFSNIWFLESKLSGPAFSCHCSCPLPIPRCSCSSIASWPPVLLNGQNCFGSSQLQLPQMMPIQRPKQTVHDLTPSRAVRHFLVSIPEHLIFCDRLSHKDWIHSCLKT